MSEPFSAQNLNSRTLLSLLFVSECRRRGKNPLQSNADWEEFLETFWPRLSALTEARRLEVLEAHLMSVEDIDLYDNAALEVCLRENSLAIGTLEDRLGADSRFSQ